MGQTPISSVAECGGPRRAPLFYGWVIVAVAFVTMGVGVSARTAFSLLFPPILDEFGWERGLTAGAFSFGFLVSAVLSPFVGRYLVEVGFSPADAAWALGFVSLAAIPGQIALGHLSDRIGREWVWTAGCLGFILCLLALLLLGASRRRPCSPSWSSCRACSAIA